MSSYYELQNTITDPVSLADAKAYLRVDFTKDDALITNMISTAIKWGEAYTARQFSNHQWIAYFDSDESGCIKLQRSPLTTLTSVETSSDGAYSAYTDFILKQKSGYSDIILNTSVTLDDTVAYTFKVTFESGYADIPPMLKDAVLEHVSFLYENRADVPSAMPNQIKNLYNHYKLIPGFA